MASNRTELAALKKILAEAHAGNWWNLKPRSCQRPILVGENSLHLL